MVKRSRAHRCKRRRLCSKVQRDGRLSLVETVASGASTFERADAIAVGTDSTVTIGGYSTSLNISVASGPPFMVAAAGSRCQFFAVRFDAETGT